MQRAARSCGSGRGNSNDKGDPFPAADVPLAKAADHLGRVRGDGRYPVCGAQRHSIQSSEIQAQLSPRTEVEPAQTAMFGQPVTCLLLYDSGQHGTDLAKEQFDQLLLDMKVSTQAVDVHTTSLEGIPEFDRYKTVVVLMSDLDALGNRLIDLMNWVKDGGSVLFAMTPQKTTYFDAISPKLGVLSSSWEYKTAESIVPTEEFMLGGGQRYEFSDPFRSSLSVSLREEATVYARTGDEGVPLVWGTKSGAGRVVVDNIGIYDKIMRGIYAASFSLLCDAAAYPVINSAVFYLDDFPSPVPGGDGSYIRRDYGMSIADFYSKVRWPDLMKLAQQYSIRFTGVMIENYEDDTQSTPVRQPDTQQFRYYGSLLLQQGGEVGFHGYNHQPLVLPDTDYKDLYSYRQWPSEGCHCGSDERADRFSKDRAAQHRGAASMCRPPTSFPLQGGRCWAAKCPRSAPLPAPTFRMARPCPMCRNSVWPATVSWSSPASYPAVWWAIPICGWPR